MTDIVQRLLSAAKLLYSNSVGCVRMHHGADPKADPPPWLAECGRDIEAAEAYLAALPSDALSVTEKTRVRPLKWERMDDPEWVGHGTDLCQYYIRVVGSSYWLPAEGDEDGIDYPSLEAAQAAAQEIYSRRILSALEPAPTAEGWKALVEQLKAAADHVARKCMGETDLPAFISIPRKPTDIDALLCEAAAELERAIPTLGWLDISSAPKDGTRIDLWAEDRRVTGAFYKDDRWQQHDRFRFRDKNRPQEGGIWQSRIINGPTHWMCIPAAPLQANGDRNG